MKKTYQDGPEVAAKFEQAMRILFHNPRLGLNQRGPSTAPSHSLRSWLGSAQDDMDFSSGRD
jgi:hypothetical protein